MLKVITLANNKGGCGKTTSAVNISSALALQGYKVLVLDLDAQGNLSETLPPVEGKEFKGSVFEALQKGRNTVSPVLTPAEVFATRNGRLDLLPSSEDMRNADLVLTRGKDYLTTVEKLLLPFRKIYDFILIDTPPALGVLTLSALYTADLVLTTVQPHYLAVQGLAKMKNTLDQLAKVRRPAPSLWVLFCMYDKRKVLHTETQQTIKKNGFNCFRSVIRENITLAEAPTVGKDIFRYSPKSHGAEDYKKATLELLKMLNKTK